tara:strand:- start:1901 stop:3673 length:1773 start_codon:yes stop_codon:yes gene_type:complete
MTKILSFDSVFIVNPIRKIYTAAISKILNGKISKNTRLILYRLDKDNVFLTDESNITGVTVGATYDSIDSMSIKFYRYIEKSEWCNSLSINNIPLYQLYPRQVKLKLEGVLRGALRIKNLSNESKQNIHIITDRQSASIMKEAFKFLNYTPANVTWKVNGLLTLCITINSLIMRFAAIINMYISSSSLPNEYFYKHVNSNAPTVLITTPKNRPADFFSMYIKKFSDEFNIIFYSLGILKITPDKYQRKRFKKTTRVFNGIFNIKNLFLSPESYIADVLLIFKNHSDLNISVDAVNSIFSNQIDAHISRCQTNALDAYFSIEARKKGIFVLADIEEEIFYCDSAICPSKSNNRGSVKMAVAKGGKILYKGNNSMINYRLKNFKGKNPYYLRELLGIDAQQKIIFYASDPSKEESQRYLTEKFLFDYFSEKNEFILIVKTHPQDKGRITNRAFIETGMSKKIILVGDAAQRGKMVSKHFTLIENFNFNCAIASSDGFLTSSSSSILQALLLDVKTGVIDKFENGFYDFLINRKASVQIFDKESLKYFLDNKKINLSGDVISHFGLKNDDEEFDLQSCLLECMNDFYRNKKKA